MGQINTGATHLRTLTLKSLLKFGKFKHNTVGDLITMRRHDILIKLYYHCSTINFSEDVLDILRITPERRIEKPGKDDTIRNLRDCIGEIIENESLLDYKMRLKEMHFKHKSGFAKRKETEFFFQKKSFNRELNRNRVTK